MARPPQKPRESAHRTADIYGWLRAIVLVAVMLIANETFVVMGLVTPVAIHGSSMAPTLLGPHIEAVCPYCDWPFAVGTDQLPKGRPFVCPDCQREFDAARPFQVVPGERVWVDRLAPPRRWDIVVFRCPERPTDYCVKRVLALPGEHVDFQKGDLLIDGQVYRKSLPEQRRVRQLVHQEQRDQPSHFTGRSHGWKRLGNRWHHSGTEPGELRYRASQAATSDRLAYNQGAIGPTHQVSDLMLRGQLQLATQATFRCQAELRGGSEIVSPPFARSGTIEWSLFDRQAVLAVDGQVLWSLQRDDPWPEPPWLSVLVAGDGVLGDLCVYRDAYCHTRPIDRWPAAGVQLAADELFVLGDNVAISEDSRTWRGLPKKLVVGVPMGVE